MSFYYPLVWIWSFSADVDIATFVIGLKRSIFLCAQFYSVLLKSACRLLFLIIDS